MDKLDLDFSALLVALAVLTGVIWGIDTWLFAAKRKSRGLEVKEPVLVEYSRSFFPVIFIVLLIRSFVAEPFRIPSDSMMPTLMDGDFILVSKFSYGIRLPVINRKIIPLSEPKRGDVVVFRYPRDPSIDYIKRVIGLPGDEITVSGRRLWVNGQEIDVQSMGPYGAQSRSRDYRQYALVTEKLPDVEHQILLGEPPIFYGGPEGVWRVGENEYFVMGDNRSNSEDSRIWGIVPEANLVGRAFFVWLSWDRKNGGIEFSRMGTVIK
jgi:signal peptidase I